MIFQPLTTRGRYPWWIPLVHMALGGPFRGLMASLRVTDVAGGRHLEAVGKKDRPVIFAFWHNREVICAEYLRRQLQPRGVRLAVMASLSTDGELAARYAAKLGYQVVRGSTSRSAVIALHRLYRSLTRDRCSVLMTPDGPRGPRYVCKPGAVILAKLSGAPIVPVSCAVSRAWRLPSWDRLFFPQPFARLAMAFGEPVVVPRELDEEGQETMTERLGETLGVLSDEAQQLLARGWSS